MLRILLVICLFFTATVARAQEPVIPNFFDPGTRLVRPDLADRPRLRFLTVTDFPPFSFIDRRKRLTGLHVDLAREICAVLRLLERCQIQAVPFAELEGALRAGDGEAILAGLPPTVERRRTLGFTSPYFRLPSRFVVKAGDALAVPDESALIDRLAEKEIGIVDGSAQAAFAQTYLNDARLRLFASRDNALDALKTGGVAAVFDDALQLSFAMQRPANRSAFAFAGGPYLSQTYFGTGLSIAVARDDEALREGLNYALRSITQNGKFAELYLRYFPVGLF